MRLRFGRDRLTITVTDDGTAVPSGSADGTGIGLIGMRERAHSVGGALQAGHRPGGGFQVTTRLPLYPVTPAPRHPENGPHDPPRAPRRRPGPAAGDLPILIDSCDDMEVVAEAADGAEAVALARVHRPDLVLMDTACPAPTGSPPPPPSVRTRTCPARTC